MNEFYERMHIIFESVFIVDVVEFIHDELEIEVHCTAMVTNRCSSFVTTTIGPYLRQPIQFQVQAYPLSSAAW